MSTIFLLGILKTTLSLYSCFENSVLNMVEGSTVRGIGVAENGVNRKWRKERGRKPSKGGFGLRVRI